MFIEAKLVFQSYLPEKITKGMLFLRKVSMLKLRTMIEYYQVFELKEIPRDMESFILTNGYPVKPHIYSITSNPDANADILALPDTIGWWDDEPDAEYEEDEEGLLRDIEVKDFNYILENYDGSIDIHVDDKLFHEHDIAQAVLYIDKVTLSIPSEKSPDYDDEDDEEDWDDMDDLTDNDHNTE